MPTAWLFELKETPDLSRPRVRPVSSWFGPTVRGRDAQLTLIPSAQSQTFVFPNGVHERHDGDEPKGVRFGVRVVLMSLT